MAKSGKRIDETVKARCRERYEAGAAVSRIAKEERVSRNTLHRYIRSEGWEPIHAAMKKAAAKQHISSARQALKSASHQGEPKAEIAAASQVVEGRQAHLKAGSIEQQTQQQEADRVGGESGGLIPLTHTTETAIAQETGPNVRPSVLEEEIARSAVLLAEHQGQISRLRSVGNRLIDKLSDVVERGEVEDVIIVKTKQGIEMRLPFLGRNESVSDALIKVSSALQKLIPLERQANSLKEEQTAGGNTLSVVIGSFGAEDRHMSDKGRTVTVLTPEGDAEPATLKDRVAHLDGSAE